MSGFFNKASVLLSLMILPVAVLSFNGCASKSPTEKSKHGGDDRGSASVLPGSNVINTDINSSGHCFSSNAGSFLSNLTDVASPVKSFDSQTSLSRPMQVSQVFQLFQQGSYKVDGKQFYLYRDRSRQKVSFCDVLREQNAKVAIFQFAGVTCIDCQVDAGKIESYLTSRGLQGRIAHILVLTDFFDDVSDFEFARFHQYAPRSKMLFDESTLWKQFSANPKLPDRATIVAMNVNMQAVVYNLPNQKMNILSAAEQLMNQSR